MGPAFTNLSLSAYFSDRETLLYLPQNLTLKWLQYDLPGVFNDNPYPAAINGSLWTLFYEVSCYGMVAAIGLVGLTKRIWTISTFLSVYTVGYVALKLINLHNHLFEHFALLAGFHELTLPFVLGMAFYHFRRYLRLRLIICAGAGAAAALAHGGSWFQEFFVLFWSYLIFYLGYLPFEPIRAYNRIGDYSYGMYIYAFPCEQIGAALWRGVSPFSLMVVSFPVTLAFAVLSWHLLECRALAYRARATGWLERCCLNYSCRT